MAKEFLNIIFQVATQSKSMSLWQETDLIKKKFRVIDIAIFIFISDYKLRRGIYELASNGKTIEPLGFEAVASEPRIPLL